MQFVIRILTSAGALLFGLLVVVVSLLSAQPVRSVETVRVPKQLYLGKEVLPDHLLYPVLMGLDRVRLERSPAGEKPMITVNYAFRRFDTAELLLEKDEPTLAFHTLEKGHVYLQRSALLVSQDHASTPEERGYIAHALVAGAQRMQALQNQLDSSDRAYVSDFLQENKATQQSIAQ